MKINSKITLNHAQSALKLTAEILEETGPRLTGIEACNQAGEMLKSNLEKYCDTTFSEKFRCSRDVFLYFIHYFSISYAMAFIFLWLGGYWIYSATVVIIVGCVMALFEFVFYKKFIDPFFKKTDGYNISGTIEPEAVLACIQIDEYFIFEIDNHKT